MHRNLTPRAVSECLHVVVTEGTNEGSRTSSISHSTSRSSTRGKTWSAYTSRRSGRVSGTQSSTARGLQEVVKAKDTEIEELKAKLAQFEAAAAAAAAAEVRLGRARLG